MCVSICAYKLYIYIYYVSSIHYTYIYTLVCMYLYIYMSMYPSMDVDVDVVGGREHETRDHISSLETPNTLLFLPLREQKLCLVKTFSDASQCFNSGASNSSLQGF